MTRLGNSGVAFDSIAGMEVRVYRDGTTAPPATAPELLATAPEPPTTAP